jgi:uncharacterized membrane protein
VHRLFAVSVLIKGVDGVLETIGGILLMFVGPKALNSLVIFLTAHELSEDPDDWFAASLRSAVHNLSSDTKLFVSVYLVAHGLVKVFLQPVSYARNFGRTRRRFGFSVSFFFTSCIALAIHTHSVS